MFDRSHKTIRQYSSNSAKQKNQKPVRAAQILIDLRKQAGLSRNALAGASGVDEKYFWDLERGLKRNPGRNVLIKLSRAPAHYSKQFTEEDVDAVLEAAGFPPAPLPDPNPAPTSLTRELYRW